jgi:MFS family permease
MSAAALSILVVTFTHGRERNLALGVWGATSGVAGALGVILGGALTSGPGWEWVFFINVPIGLAAGVASLRFVAKHRAPERPPLDPLGALTATTGIGLLIFAIVRTEQEGAGARRPRWAASRAPSPCLPRSWRSRRATARRWCRSASFACVTSAAATRSSCCSVA